MVANLGNDYAVGPPPSSSHRLWLFKISIIIKEDWTEYIMSANGTESHKYIYIHKNNVIKQTFNFLIVKRGILVELKSLPAHASI